MLPFSTASEPVEMLDEASQWKVFQCVAVDFLGFVPVQMLEFLRISSCALRAEYAVVLRQSNPRCPAIFYL